MAAARALAAFLAAFPATLLATLLAACASRPPAPGPQPAFAGRIAVRADDAQGHAAHSVSGQFELSGDAHDGQLLLSGPLGTLVARARWSSRSAGAPPDDIVLEAQGRTTHYADFGAMTEAALGEALPVPALFDWLSGRPWPGSAATFDAAHGAFDQFGWHVDRSRLDREGVLAADRGEPAPALHVRVKLDGAAGTLSAAPAAPAASAPSAPNSP